MRPISTAVAALVLLTGCSSSALLPEAELSPSAESAEVRAEIDETFSLRVGAVASVAETGLVVGFRGVEGDSRCPTNVQCVWAGDAEVVVGVAEDGGSWTWYALHSGLEPRTAELGGFRLELRGLDPAATQGSPIPANEYEAELRLTRG